MTRKLALLAKTAITWTKPLAALARLAVALSARINLAAKLVEKITLGLILVTTSVSLASAPLTLTLQHV